MIVMCNSVLFRKRLHVRLPSGQQNGFFAGTQVELIMKISGHKNVTEFYKYIRIEPVAAARKIKDL